MFFEVQPTVRRISKGCCQCGSQFLTTRFKHSYDQVTFRIALFKYYHNSDGNRSHPDVLSYCWF